MRNLLHSFLVCHGLPVCVDVGIEVTASCVSQSEENEYDKFCGSALGASIFSLTRFVFRVSGLRFRA